LKWSRCGRNASGCRARLIRRRLFLRSIQRLRRPRPAERARPAADARNADIHLVLAVARPALLPRVGLPPIDVQNRCRRHFPAVR
jgi:hypothetical protein